MKTKHTPGPWLTRDGFSSDEIEIFAPNPKIKKPFFPTELAVVGFDEDEPAEGKANARLIAAAPELLEALKRAEHLLDATMRYLREHEIACEHTIVYDDAECDGFCLADDCESHAEYVRAILSKAGGSQ